MGLSIFNRYVGTVSGALAATQVEDQVSPVIYTPLLEWGPALIVGVTTLAILIVLRLNNSAHVKTEARWGQWGRLLILPLLGLSGLLVSCSPPKIDHLVEIKNNETAFLVPLEGASQESQTKFMSIDFLEHSKIGTKRIIIPVRERQTGRFYWEIEWIPSMRVITVDRTPITREWVDSPSRGTSTQSQGIIVESVESIGFSVGINLTAMIREEDAARFLYYYPSSSLADVMDKNVRGFVQSILSREFGSRKLSECQIEKRIVSETCFKETKEHFKQLGMTIDNLGIAEGLIYENKEVQKAIDATFVAETMIRRNVNERKAQEEVNMKELAMAQNDRAKAEEFRKASEAQTAMIRLKIEEMNAQSKLEAAKRWDGRVPANILPSGSGFLFNLDEKIGK